MDVVGFAFIVGKSTDEAVQNDLEAESSKHKDIVQVNMIDDYANLTIKVAGLFNWLNHNCPEVAFLLKIDDDVYLNVRNLVTMLQSIDPSRLSVYGSAIKDNPVQRDRKSKLPQDQIAHV